MSREIRLWEQQKMQAGETEGQVTGQRQLYAAGFSRSDDLCWRSHENTPEEGERTEEPMRLHARACVHMWGAHAHT